MRIVLSVAAMIVLACGPSPLDTRQRLQSPGLAVSFDQEFQLAIGGSASVSGTDVTVTFRAVANDSRCPRLVQCIAAGIALIELDLDRAGHTTRLNLTNGTQVWTGTTRWAPIAFAAGYAVEFRALSPDPETPEPIPSTDYRVTIVVSALPALPGIPVPFTSLGSACCGGLDTAALIVVRDSATWRAVWTQGQGDIPVPAVDFGQEMVLVVALGERPTAGYLIDVSGAAREANVLHVQALERQPGGDCLTAQVITHPTDMVRMPIVDDPFDLSIARRARACGP